MPTTNRTRVAALLALWMAALVWTPSAEGDVEELVSNLPVGTLAYWAMDPGPSEREGREGHNPSADRLLLLATLRAAVSSGIAGSKSQAQWVEGLLAAAMVGEVPHRLAVLDFRAHRAEGATKAEIDGLQIVLELRTKARHEEYLRTLRAILIDAANAKGLMDDARGTQRKLSLPNGRTGVVYRAHSWPAWREVSWCSDDDRFVIALGEGALERWFATDEDEGHAGVRKLLRGVPREIAAWETVEAFLDLEALRERFPEGFDEGRVERMVAALDLTDASALMVRASLVKSKTAPSLLAIDWMRAVDGGFETLALTESSWPEGIGEAAFPVRGASYIVIARADWRAIYDRAMRIHFATFRHASAEREQGKHLKWMQAHRGALEAVFDGLTPWVVLADTPEPLLPIPGLGSVFVAAKDGVDAVTLDERMQTLLGSFKGVVRTEDGVWSLKVDDAGLVRVPAWAFIDGKRHAMLAGGWGPPVVAHARKVIGDQ